MHKHSASGRGPHELHLELTQRHSRHTIACQHLQRQEPFGSTAADDAACERSGHEVNRRNRISIFWNCAPEEILDLSTTCRTPHAPAAAKPIDSLD